MTPLTRIAIAAGVLALALALWAAPAAAPAAAGQYQIEVTDEMLQCVADCIVELGEDEAEACKQKCSGIRVDMSHEEVDCMAVYKACRKDCPEGDDACRQTCKDALMQCY